MTQYPENFYLIGADLSLKRPGFCRIRVTDSRIESVQLFCIDNKTKKKPRGQLLQQIADQFNAIIPEEENTETFFVREKSINNCNAKFARSGSLAISGVSQVVGITDYFLWIRKHAEWDELYPSSIKKLVTNNGKAEKSDVALALIDFIGPQQYRYDDESDAAAVAVAWLIQHKFVFKGEQDEQQRD